MTDSVEFKEAMSFLAAAVCVVTTRVDEEVFGFTASSVCSVSADPPTMLVCVNRDSTSYTKLRLSGVLAINVLASRHEALSRAFSSKLTPEERFRQGNWTELKTGSPILQDSLVSFDCKIEAVNEVGTHAIYICRVQGIRFGASGQALLYYRRNYHGLEMAPEVSEARLEKIA